MADMSPFVFLPLFMILNAALAVVLADILTDKAESSGHSQAADAKSPLGTAA
jgi:hypothetical protein